MLGSNKITIASEKRKITLNINSVLYVVMKRNVALVHTIGGEIYKTRLTLSELEKLLGESFIKVSRSVLVSVMAIHDIDDVIELNNGEVLQYTVRNKKEILSKLRAQQEIVIKHFRGSESETVEGGLQSHYACFDNMPIAFADIEMLFDDKKSAVDWRFCYANQALATLENVPLSELVGATFGGIFENMNVKWLRLYERAVLYGETLEVVDHSPEIDTDLRVICFPTFKGHCGCMLFPVSRLHFTQISPEGSNVLLRYFKALLNTETNN